MIQKAVVLLLAVASVAACVCCGSTANHYVYATIPQANQVIAFREDPNSGVLIEITGSPYSVGDGANSLVIHPSGKFLYVANPGQEENDISLFNIAATGGFLTEVPPRTSVSPATLPQFLAMDPAGAYLYVANARGFGQEPNFEGAVPTHTSNGHILQVLQDSNVVWSTLEKIDLRKLPLTAMTLSTLKYARVPRNPPPNKMVPPLRSLQRSAFIKHVVFILEENKTYDSMLGDLTDAQGHPYGNGDASLVSFGANITPNLHALAREFGLATNLYADAEESDAGHQFAAAGIVPVMGAGSSSDAKQPEPLEAGSAVSAVLVRGDMDIEATCTVTYIDSERLLEAYRNAHPRA